jgi:hypothetical protein
VAGIVFRNHWSHRHAQSSVDDHGPFRGGHDRIAVGFDQFGQVFSQSCHAKDQVDEGFNIDRHASSESREQRSGSKSENHVSGVAIGQGRQARDVIIEQLHRRSSQSEQDLGPKCGIHGEANDCLHCRTNHGLDDGAGHGRSDGALHGLEGVAYLALGSEVDPHSTRLRLVDQPGPECFHDHWQLRARRCDRFIGVDHRDGGDAIDAVGGEHLHGTGPGNPLLALPYGSEHLSPRPVGVDAGKIRDDSGVPGAPPGVIDGVG